MSLSSAKELYTSLDMVIQGLKPTTPDSVADYRYDKTLRVERSHTRIEAGPPSQPKPQYLPMHWFPHTHPEGQPYFYLQSRLRIVTEAYLYRPEVMEKITYWSTAVEALLAERAITLGDGVELLLQLDEHDSDCCHYYFVDHSIRSIFWLHEVSTQDFNLGPVASKSHLKLALEGLYWHHVEFFPVHIAIHSHAVVELISVFTHARADCITSPVSTFPYTADQCAGFLDILRGCRGDSPNGFTNCTIARLWSDVANYRFINHHDQETVRLSRNQSITNPRSAPQPKLQMIASTTSRLLFGVPELYRARLDDMFVDDNIHGSQWLSFMSSTSDEWKLSLSWAFSSILCTVLLSLARGASSYLTTSSVLASSSSILSGMLLIRQHKTLKECTAQEAAEYLASVRSTTFGFHPIALVYSLPNALCMWGVLLFTLQAVLIGFHVIGNAVAAGVAVCVIVLAFGIWFTAGPSKSEGWISRASSMFQLRRHTVEIDSNV